MRFVCRTTVPSLYLWKSSCWEGTALMKPHSNTFLSRKRYAVCLDWKFRQKNTLIDQFDNQYLFWILQVGDASVGWALGYMLALSNLLPAEVPAAKKSLSLEVWGLLLFIVVVLLVATLLFTAIKVCFIKKHGKPVWQRSVDYQEPNTISENLWMYLIQPCQKLCFKKMQNIAFIILLTMIRD